MYLMYYNELTVSKLTSTLVKLICFYVYSFIRFSLLEFTHSVRFHIPKTNFVIYFLKQYLQRYEMRRKGESISVIPFFFSPLLTQQNTFKYYFIAVPVRTDAYKSGVK